MEALLVNIIITKETNHDNHVVDGECGHDDD